MNSLLAYNLFEFWFAPFAKFAFMRRALAGSIALAAGCGPLGVFLMLRRMSLMGDALSHAILPGAALGFMVAGLSTLALALGGLVAGLSVALLSTFVTRFTSLAEDASLAGFYLISLAIGVVMISNHGNHVDLMNVLFGSVLSVSHDLLLMTTLITSSTLLILATVYRPLVIDTFDPFFFASIKGHGFFFHALLLTLVVLNLVAAFQAMGTLMALGLMLLPALAASFWAKEVWRLTVIAAIVGAVSGYFGLVVSFHFDHPSGPSIVLIAGCFYIFSVCFGRYSSLLRMG
jgi:zinc/manganese transport system permease protein